MAFTIVFTPRAEENLSVLRKSDQQTIADAVAVQLTHQRGRPTKKRKRLEANPLAPWELRVREFRVFYTIIAVSVVILRKL